jgi:hypothetical protein
VKHFTTFLIYNAAFYHQTYKSDRLSRQPWVLFVTQTKRRGIPRISARKRTRSECMSCNNDACCCCSYTNRNLLLRRKLNRRSVLPQFISAVHLDWRDQTYLARTKSCALSTNVGNGLEEKRVHFYRKIGLSCGINCTRLALTSPHALATLLANNSPPPRRSRGQ